MTRNQTSVLAFSIGGAFDPRAGCLKVVAAHTDSPALKLSPVAKMVRAGYMQPAVQTYGGGIWHTWFDRDLGLAGKVILRNPETKGLEYRLVHCKEGLLRIPNLAVHFTRSYNKFEFNLEEHLRPFIATEHIDNIVKPETKVSSEMLAREFPAVVKAIAEELKVDPASIIDFDLNLVDVQPAGLTGVYKEFVSSGRLDNQISCHCGLEAFKDLHEKPGFLRNDRDINILIMFDHEEVGSKSMQGALSTYLAAVSRRIFQRAANSSHAEELFNAALGRSFIISADLAHAVNPNYASCHQEAHPVHLHKGVVVKTNYNVSYATDSTSSVILKEIAGKAKVPTQEFVVKCDSPCGTTVGPLLNTNTCMKTVDIGIGQLAMHSIREVCGTTDVMHYYRLVKAFYEEYGKIDRSLLEG